jgi:uncharacterized protein with HEPN domain
MSKREDKLLILDIMLACKNIMEYTDGMDYKAFLKDKKTIDAVVRNIEIIGEATKKVSESIKKQNPTIEWREIAKTRDKLIHGYFGVDVFLVWNIVSRDISSLYEKIKKITE